MIGHHPLWLPGVTAVITRGDDHILLVKRSDNGAWTPVTGIVDPGEEPAIAAAREALEETGVVISVDRLAATTVLPEFTYDNGDRASYLDLTFACTWLSGEAYVADDESTDVRWWPIDDLPPMSHAHGEPDRGRALRRARGALRREGARRSKDRQPLRPELPVLGVAACAAGWVGVLLGPDGTTHRPCRRADAPALVGPRCRETADPSAGRDRHSRCGLPDHGAVGRAVAEARQPSSSARTSRV